MKVLFHTDEYYPTAQACSYRMQVFVDKFMELGDQVVVIASSANKDPDASDYREHAERIIYAPAVRMKKKTTIMRMLNNASFGLTSILASLKAGSVDVVITTSTPVLSSIPGWLISKIKGAMLVYDVRDIWPDVAIEMGSFSENSFYAKVFSHITTFMYKHADIITTVSPGKVTKIKSHLMRQTKEIEQIADKVVLVGNGFDESVENNSIDQDIIRQFGLDSKFTCVYIGNIGLAQGLGALLDIAKNTKHQDVQFLIFGKGAEKNVLEERAKEYGLKNLKFCGVVDHSKVTTILSNAKLSFIPLKNSNMRDSIPTKIYEALGIGCPVLLYAEGDSCKIIEETGFGRTVSPKHPELLVKAFDEMIDNYESILSNKAKAASLMHTKYSRQKIATSFEKLIRNFAR